MRGDFDPHLVQEQLERILSSPGFAQNERLSSFLRFVVERELEGKAHELKESLLGIEVFRRTPGYDPKQDSIVRTEAAKLRDRLAKYYAAAGAADPVRIDLPKGGYVPVYYRTDCEVPRRNALRTWGLKVASLAATALLATGGWLWTLQKDSPVPIAVLPLHNLSQSADEYYSDGLTAEIISDLSTIEGLAVRSQTSSFALKAKPRNIREIGEQLGVDYILEGSVVRSSEHLRVKVQFVRVRDDLPVWSGKFDRKVDGDFAIQDEIARGIVNSLRLTLGRGRRRYESSAEAYDLYLRARALPVRLGLPGFDQSIEILEQALAKDSSFAPAHAALAAAYAARSNRFRYDSPEQTRKMHTAAERALRLDPLLAEAHSAMGIAHARSARWEDAERSFRRALELEPRRSMSHFDYAIYVLSPLRRINEALHQLRLAEESDPLSNFVHFQFGYLLTSAGRYDEAIGHCRKMADDHPEKNRCLGRALLELGRIEEAIAYFSKGDPATYRANLAYAYARAGRREQADIIGANATPVQLALLYAGFGDKERTIQALQRLTEVGPVRTGWLLGTSEFSFVRGDPRIIELRRTVGLPD